MTPEQRDVLLGLRVGPTDLAMAESMSPEPLRRFIETRSARRSHELGLPAWIRANPATAVRMTEAEARPREDSGRFAASGVNAYDPVLLASDPAHIYGAANDLRNAKRVRVSGHGAAAQAAANQIVSRVPDLQTQTAPMTINGTPHLEIKVRETTSPTTDADAPRVVAVDLGDLPAQPGATLPDGTEDALSRLVEAGFEVVVVVASEEAADAAQDWLAEQGVMKYVSFVTDEEPDAAASVGVDALGVGDGWADALAGLDVEGVAHTTLSEAGWLVGFAPGYRLARNLAAVAELAFRRRAAEVMREAGFGARPSGPSPGHIALRDAGVPMRDGAGPGPQPPDVTDEVPDVSPPAVDVHAALAAAGVPGPDRGIRPTPGLEAPLSPGQALRDVSVPIRRMAS